MKIKPNIAYHCANRELAEKFLRDNNLVENSHNKKLINSIYESKDTICFENVEISTRWDFYKYYKNNNYEIIEYTGKEQKTETAWVVKRDDGKFVYITNNYNIEFMDDIWFAHKFYEKDNYDAYENCKQYIKQRQLKNCKPVKVEIREVEE